MESEEKTRYKAIFDSLMMGVVIIGQDFRIAAYNEQMRAWFPEVRVGMFCHDILGCGSECNGVGCLVHQTFIDGCRHEKKFRVVKDDEEIKVYRMVVYPMRQPSGEQTIAAAIRVVEDVTECANREATDIQTLQLAAVGQLAAGIAHEFNNINSVVKGHLELLYQDDSLSQKNRDQIKVMLEVVRQGIDITKNMLMFARDRKGRATGTFIADIVRDVLSIISNDLRSEGVEVIVDHQPNVRVLVNVSQMGQVIINLLLNARHALTGRNIKRLTIRSWCDSKSAYISVEDTGCGIAEKNIKKLFSPFFTTKGEHAESGSQMSYVKGTGLGLSICHTIVEKHHSGKILVESKEGVGSKFTVVLPLFEGPVEIKKSSTVMMKALTPGNGERVLVVDDEPKISSVIKMVLTNQGYSVVCCSDSLKALKLYNEKPFDVVISDIKMPGISGLEMAEYLYEMKPRPVTILMTGALQDEASVKPPKADAMLTKPFAFEDMLAIISLGLFGRKSAKDIA